MSTQDRLRFTCMFAMVVGAAGAFDPADQSSINGDLVVRLGDSSLHPVDLDLFDDGYARYRALVYASEKVIRSQELGWIKAGIFTPIADSHELALAA